MFKALNSPFKGFYPNVNPFGISPRYDGYVSVPKLNQTDDDISSTIKKVDDRKDANAEIESGEIVRQTLANGGTLLHKATGKKHNANGKPGGIPVNLPDGSFIFSNYKTTSLNKEELEKYKLGGYSKKINNNTPSKILEKNVDIKHYNEMERYIQETQNPVQFKTAQLMKEKYDKAIAKIAALQENKKTEEAPDFAYLSEDSPEKQTNETMAEMYRNGGYVLPRFQDGKANFYSPFDPTYSQLNPNNLFIPAPPDYMNSGKQHKNKSGYYGDIQDGLNPYTRDWYQRVAGEPLGNNIDALQQLYSNMHQQRWNTGYNSGINTTSDGKVGNRTNAYYYDNENVQGTNPGEIDLNAYYNGPEDQRISIANSYGVTPEQIDKYKKSAIAKLYVSGKPVGHQQILNGEEKTPTTEENTFDSDYVDKTKYALSGEQGTKFDWLKPYDNTPNALSLLGNMAQYPRAFVPSLSLEQPVRLREQQIDAQPGVNDILSNRYASLKASNQYLPSSQAMAQYVDSDTNKNMTDYRNQINQSNQNVSTDIHNKNAMEQNRVVNSNNDRRAQHVDKMNELYQNLANERNTIGATNLNIIGKGIKEKNDYDNSIDLLKKSYGWSVQNDMSRGDEFAALKKYINQLDTMGVDENTKRLLLINYSKQQSKQSINPYNQFMQSQRQQD